MSNFCVANNVDLDKSVYFCECSANSSWPNLKLSYSSTYEHHIVEEATGPFSETQMCMGFTRAKHSCKLCIGATDMYVVCG
jgi:hypothetical protein